MRNVVIALAAIFFLGLCVLPLAYMITVSFFSPDGVLTLANYQALLTEPRQRGLLVTSGTLAAASAVVAAMIGTPLGLLLARVDLPLKYVLRLALVVPLVIPPYILALAWTELGGPGGLFAWLLGRDVFGAAAYSATAAAMVLAVAFYPLSMLASEAAARLVGARLEEAGLLVAHPRRVLWRIILPLISPSVAAAALVTFVLALSEFGVPSVLRVRVFTTEIFTAFAALYDFGAATALCVPLLILSLLASLSVKLAGGDRLLTTRRHFRGGRLVPLGRWRTPAIAGVLLVISISVVLPIGVLLWKVRRVETITTAVAASSTAIANSLWMSSLSAILIVSLGVLLGYGRARAHTRLRESIDLAFVMIFAVPSTVVGVGLIALWNRPGLLGDVYGTRAIIVVACLARFAPVAALILAAAIRQIPRSLEEAAAVAGITWPRTFISILIPQIRKGLAAALAISVIFAFGELGATVLVAPPGESTLPIRTYTMIANAPESDIAALALMQAGIAVLPLALFGVFAGRETRAEVVGE